MNAINKYTKLGSLLWMKKTPINTKIKIIKANILKTASLTNEKNNLLYT